MPVTLPMAHGGQLGEASGGVLLLNSSGLEGKAAAALAGYMGAGECVLHATTHAERLSVPATASVWCMMYGSDLAKGGGLPTHAATSNGCPSGESIAGRFGAAFLRQFDVLVDCCEAADGDAALGALLEGGAWAGGARGQEAKGKYVCHMSVGLLQMACW